MDDAARGQVAASAAEVYEEFFVPALFGQFAAAAVEVTKVGVGGRLLDVGTGTGVVARAALETVGPSGHVVGLDINPGMLDVARRLSDDITWVHGSAEDIPADDDSFDAVVCQFALMFLERPRDALAEMARVVRSGGRVVVSTWADVSQSPGYAAMVELLDREIGRAAADALLAPFSIGTEDEFADRFEGCLDVVEVRTHPGVARFLSLEAWMHTDVRGWTLSDMIDDDDFERLVVAARHHLQRFVRPDGRVEFPAPAIIGVAVPP
jgi:SAM-dependent methyltransferase